GGWSPSLSSMHRSLRVLSSPLAASRHTVLAARRGDCLRRDSLPLPLPLRTLSTVSSSALRVPLPSSLRSFSDERKGSSRFSKKISHKISVFLRVLNDPAIEA
ncbi:hypothetical protein PMAYCL1PPCAC_11807, partial [Pristionchus mayeri]